MKENGIDELNLMKDKAFFDVLCGCVVLAAYVMMIPPNLSQFAIPEVTQGDLMTFMVVITFMAIWGLSRIGNGLVVYRYCYRKMASIKRLDDDAIGGTD